ncbi:MAG: YigZ family protein [Alcaligenaceae bacterium]|nr:YigZ family protein [Alcaligenaceae bacterium]
MLELTTAVSYEEVIKKSLFIVHAAPVKSADEALRFIEAHSQPDATHNCWAFRIGEEYRFNDDGEPGGTAGRPILAAIEGRDLTNTVVLVIRYYGGIKLGTGGLVRAYGGTAAKCLHEAPKREIVAMSRVFCDCPYSEMERVKVQLSQDGVQLVSEDFDDIGVKWEWLIPVPLVSELWESHRNLTRGQANWEIISEEEMI